jgi:ligand-binding sensor domain-containing protein/two-component sensor histidine kinase
MTRSLLTVFLCIIFVCPFAQQVFFKSFTVQDGLVANPVRSIYQDSKGFIWIGTFEGISRYDGYKFTNYTTNNGLSHNFINGFYQLGDQLLIAENNGAVDIVQNNSIHRALLLNSAVNIIVPDKQRILFATDTAGIYEYRNGKIVQQYRLNKVAFGHIVEYNDSLLVASGVDDNLVFFHKNLKPFYWAQHLNLHFNFLFRDSKKRVWVGTSGGLQLLPSSIKKNQAFAYEPLPAAFNFASLSQTEIYSMVEEKEGGFWFGTSKGLVHLFADGNYQVYNEKDGLPSSTIYTLFFDKENNLWIGTSLGLSKWVSKNNVIFFNTEKKQFKNDINSIQLLPGKKIILSSQHGLQQFNYATKEFEDVEAAVSGSCIPVAGTWPVLLIRNDAICVLDEERNTEREVKKIDKEIPGLSNACAHSSGTIFLGAFNGLYAVQNSNIKKILPYRVTSLIADGNGFIWAGTWTQGLYRIEVKKNDSISFNVQQITLLSGQKEIRSLYADSKKNIWAGTRYGGAFQLRPKLNANYEVTSFNRNSGLMSDWIKSFAELPNGDMWIGNSLGLDRLVKTPDGYRVFNFSKAINFFAQIEGIASVGNDHWICLANKGIALFHDEELHKNLPLPATFLSASFGVLEKKLTLFSFNDHVVLDHNQNTARFEFSALGFANEKQILYSFRLKGSNDTTWSKPENIHEAFYASLSPGNYSFEVRTIGWNGREGTPTSLSFRIKAPFWNQWWFYAVCIAFIALFFYSLYRYRIRQLLRVQKVRNRIATDLHDDIGSSLTNISILSELSNKNILQPDKAQPFLQRISEEVQASSQAMDDIIWSVNSRNDSLPEVMARMRRYAAELFDTSNINCHLLLDENSANKKLSMEQRRDIYLIYKEALNNIHKHAHANNVWIEVNQNQNYLSLKIKDDGKGFDTGLSTHRNGLKNLRSRVEKWNGKITIQSEENKGTGIEIKIPLKD